MTTIPTTLKSTAAGFEPAFGHVSTGGDRHADLLAAIAIVGRVSLSDVFKSAETLGMPKTGPYYQYMTESLLSSVGASFGLALTNWKECALIEKLPDLSIVLVNYDLDYEAGSACVIHKARASHDGNIVTYAIDPNATTPGQLIRTDLEAFTPAWHIGVHVMKAAGRKAN